MYCICIVVPGFTNYYSWKATLEFGMFSQVIKTQFINKNLSKIKKSSFNIILSSTTSIIYYHQKKK